MSVLRSGTDIFHEGTSLGFSNLLSLPLYLSELNVNVVNVVNVECECGPVNVVNVDLCPQYSMK